MAGEIWTHGGNTELEAWIGGESRRVIVTGAAIDAYLRSHPNEAVATSAADRREFVRLHLREIIEAANRKLAATSETAHIVKIQSGEL